MVTEGDQWHQSMKIYRGFHRDGGAEPMVPKGWQIGTKRRRVRILGIQGTGRNLDRDGAPMLEMGI